MHRGFMEFSGAAAIWISETWSSFFPLEGGQIIDAAVSKMLQEVLAIRALGKRNLQLFRESMAVFSFAVQTRHFSLRNSATNGIWTAFALGFQTHNQAPFDALTSAKSVTWRLNTYTGDWRVPAEQYRNWLEQTFNPWRHVGNASMG